jgi:general secretion pathway protein E
MNARIQAAPPQIGRPGHRLDIVQLLQALADDGLVDRQQAAEQGQYARLSSQPAQAIIALAERQLKSPLQGGRVLDLESLTRWAAGRCGLEYVHIDPLKVDFSKVAEVMSVQYASRFSILPLEVRPGEVVVAVSEPFITDWVDEISALMRRPVRRVMANASDISRYIVEFYTLARSVRGAARGNASITGPSDFEQLVEMGRSGRNLDANDQHIVSIVDWLWQYAFEQRASDIHLEPRRETATVRFRIDGVLHSVYQVPTSVMHAMISRMKILARMDIVEKRRPQDGRIKTRTVEGREIELRLATLPTAFGEKLVIRIFDPEVLLRDFEDLGFGPQELQLWNAMTGRPDGIVLVTGPTGSGKTTTLYTTLKRLATEEVNVCTVEDPIEMVEPTFNQMQVQHGIDLGFADGIRALMRQDPDIIMVGEIRDLETAQMAVQAALTGHLVLSTLHTNDAPSAITRLLDLGVPPYLISATVVGVMAQRLVRTLCPACKALDDGPEESTWTSLIRPYRAARPSRVYRPVGCLECRMTGYKGRTGLYEMLPFDEGLRAMIDSTPDLRHLRARAMQDGMQPLRLAGARKVMAGLTTVEEVLKAAPPIEVASSVGSAGLGVTSPTPASPVQVPAV